MFEQQPPEVELGVGKAGVARDGAAQTRDRLIAFAEAGQCHAEIAVRGGCIGVEAIARSR